MLISVYSTSILRPPIKPLCFSVFQYHGVRCADSYTELGVIRSGHGHWSGEWLMTFKLHLKHYLLQLQHHVLHNNYHR